MASGQLLLFGVLIGNGLLGLLGIQVTLIESLPISFTTFIDHIVIVISQDQSRIIIQVSVAEAF